MGHEKGFSYLQFISVLVIELEHLRLALNIPGIFPNSDLINHSRHTISHDHLHSPLKRGATLKVLSRFSFVL